ncbi:MAG: chemotaxis protein CheW [Ignavibacteriota bacterium]
MGVISLKAYHEGGQVNIEVADDGAGVDVARVKVKALEKGLIRSEQAERMSDHEAMHLMFLPGFSTAKAVTNVSGRGVGLDVCALQCRAHRRHGRRVQHQRQGDVDSSEDPPHIGHYSGLVAVSGGERFLIPQASLLELIRIEGDSSGKIERVHGTPVYRRRGHLLPVAFLSQVLGLESAAESDVLNIVVLQAEDRQFGLVVDGIKDTQEIVVKPLGKQLKGLSVYSGATIMGDGRVALILDVLGHRPTIGSAGQSRGADPYGGAESGDIGIRKSAHPSFPRRIVLAVGSATVVGGAARRISTGTVERAGGRHVVQYRGGILTLVSLASVLEPESPRNIAATQDPVQAIVVADGQRSLGIMVDQILDIVDEVVTIRQSTNRSGLLGSAVVGKQVTDFLDLRTVVQTAAPEWLTGDTGRRESVVMLADPSPFVRGLIRGELEMGGHRVLEASDAIEALSGMQGRDVGLVLAAVNLPPEGCHGLQEAMRQQPGVADIPVMELALSRDNRESMLASIGRLASAVMVDELKTPSLEGLE